MFSSITVDGLTYRMFEDKYSRPVLFKVFSVYCNGSSTIGPIWSLTSSMTVLCLRAALEENPLPLLGGKTYSIAGTSAESN